MKRRRVVIGLTGGVASGKSTVLKEWKRLGAAVVDSDELAREAVRRGRPAWRRIVRAFGKEILLPGGELNRPLLRNRVFARPALRKMLEKIVHPEVIRGIRKAVSGGRGVVVADIPLLFEAGLRGLADKTVVVWAPRRVQKARLMKRGGIGPKEAELFLKAQWPLDRKRRLADEVIDNSGALSRTRRQVRELDRRLSLLYIKGNIEGTAPSGEKGS